ncbi:Alpha/Beta hydrolase protein [Aspergillus ambiguus]|uniref:alpha/beta hydrolase n=1 Tax=Aspergillus ambiguus TaxID=176160 RepID=UPI003CCE4421
MDDKLLLGDTVAKRPRHPLRRNYWILAPLIILWSMFIINNRSRFSSSRSPTFLEYSGEHIRWEPCGNSKAESLECSSIDVPIDQFDAPNSRNEAFTIPLIRMRGANATRNILVNPGGPGISGIQFMSDYGEQLKALVGEGFHLVSFDPRGVHNSTPAASCYPDDDTRHELSRVRYHRLFGDSREVYAWAQNFARACSDTMGDYAQYINTPQTAADMNSILDALGQKDMAYWGFSYGSLLGQTYAGLFPDRSKRIIIDGVVDQYEWYEGVYEAESLEDTDKVLDGFFDECIKAGAERCALASLTTSPKVLRDTVLSYMDKLREQPIPVYINNSMHGLLDNTTVWYNGILYALYSPAAEWASLADNLYTLIQGNATNMFLACNHGSPIQISRESNAILTLNDGRNGLDYWPQNRQALLDKIVPYYNKSLFGAYWIKMLYMKQQWAIPRTHNYVPRRVKTAHPILIVSTSYDPVCPLVSALSAYKSFENSQVVEIKGYGHTSISTPSICAVKYIRDFLYRGEMPPSYTQCEVDVPYFWEEGQDDQVPGQKMFDDPVDSFIHRAQQNLAMAWAR